MFLGKLVGADVGVEQASIDDILCRDGQALRHKESSSGLCINTPFSHGFLKRCLRLGCRC